MALPQHDASRNMTELSYLYLISKCNILPGELAVLLEPHYVIRQKSPRDILHLSNQEIEVALAEAAIIMVDWNMQSPAVILALRDTVHHLAVPLVVLCGPNQAEQVAALVVGADEVLVRPIKPVLLQARIIAYRRLTSHLRPMLNGDGAQVGMVPSLQTLLPAHHEVVVEGPLTLDRSSRQCYVHGQPLDLTPRGFDLIAYLMDHVGVCVSREEVLYQVWNIDFDPETNIVDVQIHDLRRKLRAHGAHRLIQTVRGAGYRLVHVEEQFTDAQV
ncbi:MAG: winged helix-turn-helix domain-containing protein [Rhodothermales bacterium]